jgi:hypothetical protein
LPDVRGMERLTLAADGRFIAAGHGDGGITVTRPS